MYVNVYVCVCFVLGSLCVFTCVFKYLGMCTCVLAYLWGLTCVLPTWECYIVKVFIVFLSIFFVSLFRVSVYHLPVSYLPGVVREELGRYWGRYTPGDKLGAKGRALLHVQTLIIVVIYIFKGIAFFTGVCYLAGPSACCYVTWFTWAADYRCGLNDAGKFE